MTREMKNSGIEWIGQIPADWNIIKSKYIFTNHKEIVGDREKDFERLSLTLNGVLKRPKDDSKGLQSESLSTYQILYEDELVFKMIDLENTSTSRVGYSPYTGLVSPVYIIFNNKEYSRYGYWYFYNLWQRNIYNTLGNNGVRSALNASDMLGLPFIQVPKEEMKKIADFLDSKVSEIDKMIAETKSSIENYKEYKQSVITEAVTKGLNKNVQMKDSGIEWIGKVPVDWEVSKVKYVSIFSPTCDISELTEKSEITYTPMEFIKNGFFINNTSLLGNVASSLTPYQEGDIVMAKVTPCFENGNIAIMENLASGFGLGSSELFVFRPITIETKYMFYWLRNTLFVQRATATMTGTGGLKRVSPYFVKNDDILLPPIEEQNAISEYLDNKCSEIDNLISEKEALIINLEEYKKSLIYEYVTGKKSVL